MYSNIKVNNTKLILLNIKLPFMRIRETETQARYAGVALT